MRADPPGPRLEQAVAQIELDRRDRAPRRGAVGILGDEVDGKVFRLDVAALPDERNQHVDRLLVVAVIDAAHLVGAAAVLLGSS